MNYSALLCTLIAFLILFLSHQTFPQTHIPEKIQFKHFTKDQGLSDNHAQWVLKDKKGFLWIGTIDGLNKYDGRKFKLFKFSPDDPNSLSGNNITALCEDKSGTLWVGTAGRGINKYNPEKNFQLILPI
jgi:ligand-binding sensor domain-containing protein